jgi:hypothetical protein
MEDMARPSGNPPPNPWARTVLWVALVALVVGAGLYVFKSLRDLPGDAVDRGVETLERLGDLAAAFRQGTVETRFLAYATRVSGSHYLQFATLEQTEVFRRTDAASILWGQLELPEVVVEATAPVTTTYYLDLDGTWDLRLDGPTVRVVAPPIEFNKPAIDASEIEYEARTTSWFRDEEEALAKLKEGLTALSIERARDNVPLVRELGRRKTAEFVESWLVRTFDDGGGYRVEIVFADEQPSVEWAEPVLSPQ